MAKVMGKKPSDLSNAEVKQHVEKGGRETGRAAAKACWDAVKEDPTTAPSCEDPYEKFLNETGRQMPSDPDKRKAAKERFNAMIVKDSMKEARKLCFQLPSKAEIKNCTDQA